ncbi:MAG: ATP synthase subunit I [Clostridia bacterium]|nr:ATP synthase subunit I [Clostridia bacterium]
MRVEPAVKKETLYILGMSLILSVVMELIFWAVGHMDYTVPLGNLLGVVIAVLNFFLMGLTVQNSIGLDEKAASEKLKLSQKLRMLMVIALAAVGVGLPCFNSLAVVIPLFFPRIAIALWPLFNKEQSPAQDDQTVD